MSFDFQGNQETLDGPAQHAATVSPNDSTDLANHTRALYVGTAGNIVVDMVRTGGSITLTGVSGFLPICVKRVRSTGTTASDIVALW